MYGENCKTYFIKISYVANFRCDEKKFLFFREKKRDFNKDYETTTYKFDK